TDFTICPWDGLTTDSCTSTHFYESTTWSEPPMMTGLNVAVPASTTHMGAACATDGDCTASGGGTCTNNVCTTKIFGGLVFTCDYKWAPSPACADGCSCLVKPKPTAPMGECCYGFGGVVETGEHCNAFVYYYPKINRTDIVCQ